MSDFEWNGADADSVILPHQPRTAVYSGRAGHVVVRQERDAYEEDDPQLLFTPQGALATAWAMIEQAHLIGVPHPSLSLMVEQEDTPARSAPETPHTASEPANNDDGPSLRAMRGDVPEAAE